MARTTFKLEGFKELDAALAALPDGLARGAAKRSMKKAGEIIAAAQRALAPVGPTGNLRDSISVQVKARNLTGLAEFGGVLSDGGSRQEAKQALRSARGERGSEGTRIVVNVGSSAPHAHLVEFGTVERHWLTGGIHIRGGRVGRGKGRRRILFTLSKGKSTGIMPANPFIRPAFDATKGVALAVLKHELAADVQRTAARYARRRAKKIGT